MDLGKHIRVRVEKVSDAKGGRTGPYPESSDSQACCFGQLGGILPVVKKKNIQEDCLTKVEGLGMGLIHENILEDLKKKCRCKGKIVVDKADLCRTIQLKGDQEQRVKDFLIREGLAAPKLVIKD
ncbi:hypothetical protein MLD38_002238 [Melastoma candidum]|uniref:Uncharacterized protein n=1 Tax=Melastoma candidum TaxID=119954 RepID=A0ACB9SF97_9MYRT|nr:hypothetical protein MLD38_002238 [Melastoma candidum]